MSDLERIGPLIPTLPPTKGKDAQQKRKRSGETPATKDRDDRPQKSDGKRHEVDEYV